MQGPGITRPAAEAEPRIPGVDAGRSLRGTCATAVAELPFFS